MASDVTMKDLQSLQATLNKKIADLESRLAKLTDEVRKTAADATSGQKAVDARLNDQQKTLADLRKLQAVEEARRLKMERAGG
ncbi:MAG: hypothetical protein JNN18_07120 [Rubrivivax sp.]|nr:hypothetical protein [Rubrivivax sp.]